MPRLPAPVPRRVREPVPESGPGRSTHAERIANLIRGGTRPAVMLALVDSFASAGIEWAFATAASHSS